MQKNPIIIIPCSGIGKPLGTVARHAVYSVVEKNRPSEASTLCLALLTMGDENAQQQVAASQCIAVDGCPSQCATKNIQQSGGNVAHSFILTQYMRQYHELKPKGIIKLNPEGVELASHLAQDISIKIDELQKRRA